MPFMSQKFLTLHPCHSLRFQLFLGILGYKHHLMPFWTCIMCIEFFPCIKYVRCLLTRLGLRIEIGDSSEKENVCLCEKNLKRKISNYLLCRFVNFLCIMKMAGHRSIFFRAFWNFVWWISDHDHILFFDFLGHLNSTTTKNIEDAIFINLFSRAI